VNVPVIEFLHHGPTTYFVISYMASPLPLIKFELFCHVHYEVKDFSWPCTWSVHHFYPISTI